MVEDNQSMEDEAMQRVQIDINANWDDEAKVWVAQSDDVPGLVTEAATVEELVGKLKIMVPELIELNRQDIGSWPINLVVPIGIGDPIAA